jgi:hypothetical protein
MPTNLRDVVQGTAALAIGMASAAGLLAFRNNFVVPAQARDTYACLQNQFEKNGAHILRDRGQAANDIVRLFGEMRYGSTLTVIRASVAEEEGFKLDHVSADRTSPETGAPPDDAPQNPDDEPPRLTQLRVDIEEGCGLKQTTPSPRHEDLVARARRAMAFQRNL